MGHQDISKRIADELKPFIFELVRHSADKNGFQTACALLRVDGLADANWDPFERSNEIFAAFYRAGRAAEKRRDSRTALLFELLSYCHAMELSALHSFLWNLLNIAEGGNYHADPFAHIARQEARGKQKKIGRWTPLSARRKFAEISKRARGTNHVKLADAIEASFSETIRNAVSHSDFILNRGSLRTVEGGAATIVPAAKVRATLDSSVGLFSAVFTVRNGYLRALAKAGAHEIRPGVTFRYLSGNNGLASGFEAVGSHRVCRFNRTRAGIELENIMPNSDESFSFGF